MLSFEHKFYLRSQCKYMNSYTAQHALNYMKAKIVNHSLKQEFIPILLKSIFPEMFNYASYCTQCHGKKMLITTTERGKIDF